jgi:hypothetical protein
MSTGVNQYNVGVNTEGGSISDELEIQRRSFWWKLAQSRSELVGYGEYQSLDANQSSSRGEARTAGTLGKVTECIERAVCTTCLRCGGAATNIVPLA